MTTGWFKSTASSDNSSCVKVKFDGAFALLGDTKHQHLGDREPVLRLPTAHFAAFVRTVRA